MSDVNEIENLPPPDQTAQQTATETAEEPSAEPTLLGDKATPPEEVAPEPFDVEKFEFPEGVEVTDELKGELAALAGEHKVSAGAMQAFVGMHAKLMQEAADRLGQAVTEGHTQLLKGWRDETTAHYKGNLESVLTKCERVIDEFAPKGDDGANQLRQVLSQTGLGNNLAVFKFLEKVADALGEATPVSAGAEPAPKDPLRAMYPTMFKEK